MADKKVPTPADLEKAQAALKEEQAIRKTLIDTMREQLGLQGTEAELQAEKLASLSAEYEASKKLLDLEIEALAVKKSAGEISDADYSATLEQIKGYQLLNAEAEKRYENEKELQALAATGDAKRQKSLDSLGSALSSNLLKFTLIGDKWRTGIAGAVADLAESGASMGDIFKKVGETLKKQFSFKNIIGSFIGNVIQQTTLAVKAVDEARTEFVKAAGTVMTTEQKNMVTEISQAQHEYGVSIVGATKNYALLNSQVAGFRQLGAAAQKEITLAVNQFEALGISAQSSANFLTFAQKAMGKTGKEAVGMMNKIYDFSRTVSASGEQLMQQFMQYEGDLAQFGDQMGQEFINLASLADKTGVSMGKLIGIAKKFDTFRGAAKAVGHLNTLIGKNVLNMKKMVGLPFSEKIKYIGQTLERTGQSFATMGRHRQKAFAAALEVDVSTMMKIVSGAADEEEKAFAKLGISTEDMKESAKAAVPIMKMLKVSMEKFIVALEPLITGLRTVVEWFAGLSTETVRMIGYVALAVVVIIGLVKAFNGLGAVVTTVTTLFPAFATSASTGLATAGKGMGSFLKSIQGGLKGALILILIAVAFLILAAAMWIFVKAFANLLDLSGNIAEFAVMMGQLTLAMTQLTLAGVLGMLGMAMLAQGIGLLALSLLLVDEDELFAIRDIFVSIAKVPNPPFGEWAAGIRSFALAAEGSLDSLKAFSNFMFTMALLDLLGGNKDGGIEQTVRLFTAVGSVDSDSIKGIEETRKLVTELRLAAEGDTADAIAKLLTGVQSALNKKQEVPPIIIKIGEYEIFKIMDKHGSQKINPTQRGAFAGQKGN